MLLKANETQQVINYFLSYLDYFQRSNEREIDSHLSTTPGKDSKISTILQRLLDQMELNPNAVYLKTPVVK